MAEAIKMPALGESVTEGTITTWLKQVGDAIEIDEPIVEVSTDKVDTEVPSPISGILDSIEVGEDETVEVGTVLAYVGTGDGAAPATTSAPESEPTLAPDPKPEPPAPAPAPMPESPKPEAPKLAPAAPAPMASSSNYVTPIVRKLAKELGVDLALVNGTGVGGRIRRQDVQAAAEAAKDSAAPAPAKPAAQAPKPAPALTSATSLVVEVDITDGPGDYLPVVLRAAAAALADHSVLNGGGGDPAFGVTLAATRGAFMPVLRGLASKNPEAIRTEIIAVTERAAKGEISPDDLFGATFCVIDDTAQQILMEIPQIPPTLVAALAVGPATGRAGVAGGQLSVRRTFFLSLSYNSAIADANVAASFLNALKAAVEHS